jgi:protocatechuate 3,4-dioxygenase beta subunit
MVSADCWIRHQSGQESRRVRDDLFTDAEGRYRFRTILPALYTGRTRHYHVKVQAPRCSVDYLPGNVAQACWLVETRLRGWGGRTRTQKCRRKLSF